MNLERRPPREIPESVRFVGILNIVFGSLGVVWNPLIIVVTMVLASQDPTDRWFERVQNDGPYRACLFGFTATATIACVVQIVSGVGLVRGRRAGWTLGVGYAFYSLIGPVAEFLLDYILVGHKILIQVGRAGDQEAFWEDMLGTLLFLSYTVLTMIYPAILLFFLMKRDVRRAFAKPQQLFDPS